VLHAKGRSFGVFKLYGMEVLKFMEELDHEEGNLDHKCKVIVVNSLSHCQKVSLMTKLRNKMFIL
jgi:hypothetical protein